MNDPIGVACTDPGWSLPLLARKTISRNAAMRPIGTNKKNELFVNIVETLNAIYDRRGNIVRADVSGMIKMKSYLTGNPIIKCQIKGDLLIGSRYSGIIK